MLGSGRWSLSTASEIVSAGAVDLESRKVWAMSASSSLIEMNEVRSPLFSCRVGDGGGESLLEMRGVLSALNLTAGRVALEDLLWDMAYDRSVIVCEVISASYNLHLTPDSRGLTCSSSWRSGHSLSLCAGIDLV